MFTGLDLAGKFAKLLEELANFLTTFAERLLSIVGALRDTDLAETPYARQIRDAIGTDSATDTVREALDVMLRSNVVADTTNLETLRARLEAMHTYEGAEPVGSITEIRDLVLGFRQQIVGPSSPVLSNTLIDIQVGLELANETITAIRDRIDILNEEVSTIRLLTLFPSSGPNIMQLAANIAECVCRLADELAPTEPDPYLDILADHPCAAGGTPVLIVRPEDWYNYGPVGWVGNPGWINPDYAVAFAVGTYDTYEGEAGGSVTLTTWEDSAPNFTNEFFVTTDQASPVIEQLYIATWNLLLGPGSPGYNPGGSSSGVTNIFKGSTGCELLIVPGIEPSYEAFSFQIADEISYPPSFNVIFYIPAPS